MFLIVLMHATAALAWDGGELYMVTINWTYIYGADQGQAVVREGDIFRGRQHPLGDRLLEIQRGESRWSGHRKYFTSEAALLRELTVLQVRAEAELKGISQQLSVYEERRLKLYSAILHARHNATLYYQIRPRQDYVIGMGIRIRTETPEQRLQVVLRSRKADDLVGDWRKEIDEIEAKIKDFENQRVVAAQTIAHSRTQRLRLGEAFKRFQMNAQNIQASWRRVRADYIRIYRPREPPVILRDGEWVRTLPHPDNSTQMWLEYKGRGYTARARYLQSWEDIQNAYLEERVLVEDKISRLNKRLEFLAARMKQYPSLAADLKYHSSGRQDPVLISQLRVRPGADGMIDLEFPVSTETVYYLDSRKASRLSRDWEDELSSLTLALKRDSATLADSKERLVRLQAQFDRIKKSLAAAQAK